VILKALEIDGMLAEAHMEMAMITWRYEWNWASAEKEFRHAIELNPGYSAARQRYGWYLFALARHDESLAQLKRALKDDPLSVYCHSNVGCALYYARRYDDAVQHLTETLEMDANYLPARVFLGWVYEQKRMFDEAISEFEKAITLSSGAPVHLACLAHAYAVCGKKVEARSLVEDLSKQSQEKYVPSYWLGPVCAALGDTGEAFRWLERAYEERDGWLVYLKVDPRLDGLHSDARFETLLRRISLPPT
jgi:Tfp pilus assembly protein PilF